MLPDACGDVFSRNIALVQRHKPDLLPVVQGESHSLLDLPPMDGTFVAFAQSLPQKEEALVFLVGLGSGREARELCARSGQEIRLVVIEPQAAMFRAALRHTDLAPLLQSDDVRFFIGPDAEVGQVLQREEDSLRALPPHLFCNKVLRDRFPAVYGPLCRQMEERLRQFRAQVGTIERHGPRLFANTVHNCPRLGMAAHVAALADMARGRPAVCVAAGPSLTKNVGLLREMRDQGLIVAVDSAAKVLLDHGIRPHCVLTIDPIPASLRKLDEVAAVWADLPLVWTPDAYHETVARFAGGPQFVMPGVNDFFRLYLSDLFGETQTFAHLESVTNAAIQLAILAGADPVVCIGLDLALTGGRNHADGCPVQWKNEIERLTVPAWNGGEVETAPVLLHQIRSIGTLVARHPERVFVDATEGGARIPGMTVASLAEVLAGLPATDEAWEARILERFRAGLRPRPESVAQRLERLRTAIQGSRKLAQRGLRAGKEARQQWRLAKMPAKRGRAMPRFKKAVIAAGNAMDQLRAAQELTNALFPLRAREHHRLIYAREKFLRRAGSSTPERRIFDELAINLDYFSSWLATLDEAERLLRPAIAALKTGRPFVGPPQAAGGGQKGGWGKNQ